MSTDYKFEGWVGHDKDCVKGNMKWEEFKPKQWEEDNVDIEISHCGICASDIHTLRSGWYPTNYPVIVGHEIVGKAVRVGKDVKHIKVGDRVGVGAQSGSCQNQKGDCEGCADGDAQHCKNVVNTFDSPWPVDKSTSKGGYATHWRGQGHWVIPIPDALPSDIAAPMLCGGVTAHHPLIQHGAGPGKSVGIVGVGGLGHFGIMSAKALGCDKVVAISRTQTKKADALKMGATDFIATDEDKDWAEKHANSLDIIVSTVSSPKLPVQEYLSLLKYKGRFVQVGAPEDVIPGFNVFALIGKRASIWGSMTGSPEDIKDMLKFFAEKGVKTWNNNVPMKQANQAIVDMDAGKARYRYVLCNH
ncbi:zinc-binding alcohol dehydrogenase [Myriangium duriaei CBS 260.36]|uniref:alcohol dehydrogenase (NADP(+)) n=1 Tax=Myriangium duriaei CBS 260.36 TaxID=1168546 RepID=A0A9P4IWC0_9PEZI|nr:zinc-binding alcohol dehydrogenase [Myriangium duriaei CBS 260.36]